MRSTVELLVMYKDEKALVIGGPEERTGLEPFPTFAEWMQEYKADYERLHVTVSAKEAVKLTEEEIAQAEVELEGVNFESNHTIKRNEVNEMTEETREMNAAGAAVAEVEPMTEPTTAPETTTEEPTPEPKAKGKTEKPAAKKEPTKAARAQRVFDQLYPKVLAGTKTRKEVVERLVEKVELTPAGAATYYQKMKKAYDAKSAETAESS